ncbi:hypothetical protein KUCAC02_013450 [Chaenocephalus aceratus]|uniref:Uncharacterized protein n=1 Tax=Chaenocephalus aceratus TaxID=36190 RepID=A0ACB9WCD9_CHAAC|nr:hypothetical protein KUCAC02_013450 [Chaenocephalus aceratus]
MHSHLTGECVYSPLWPSSSTENVKRLRRKRGGRERDSAWTVMRQDSSTARARCYITHRLDLNIALEHWGCLSEPPGSVELQLSLFLGEGPQRLILS